MTTSRTAAPGGSGLTGRGQAVALVKEFLRRPSDANGYPRSRTTPALVFTGPRGSGKSALLDEIARKADQNRPWARVNCEAYADRSVRDLLTHLAFALHEGCPDYGTLTFPRFVIGQLVLLLDLDPANPRACREQVEQALEKHRKVDSLREFLGSATPELLGSIPTVNQVPGVATLGRYLPDLFLDRVVSRQRGRRVVLGRAQNWYGDQDRGRGKDPLDVLVKLNRAASGDTMDEDAGQVDELLWAAFLADLREAFRARGAEKRSSNCAVLLDNIDQRLGRDFLDALGEARRAHPSTDADPLTVIGAARGELPGRSATPAAPLGKASYKDFTDQVDAGADSSCYRVELEDLKPDEVARMVSGLPTDIAHPKFLGRAVHRFTGGNPGATRLLLDAIADTGGQVSELARLLDAAPERLGGETVQERVLGDLIADTRARADLTTSAAARDEDQALQMLACSPFFTDRNVDTCGVFRPWFWGEDRKMQPVLRRLLLRELAARDDDAGNSWYYVHSWLRDQCRKSTGDDRGVGELHHALALGEVEHVARRMAEQLSAGSAAAWYARLRSITAAPRRARQDRSPIEEFAALNEWSDPAESAVAATGRLVTALWISADPLTSPGALDQRVRTSLIDVAPHVGEGGMAVLYDESRKWDS